MKPKNVIFCVGTKTDLSECMLKSRLLKRLTVSVTLFKQILAVYPIRRESSKYFTDRCPLDLKCLKGGGHDFGKFPCSRCRTIRQHSVLKIIVFPIYTFLNIFENLIFMYGNAIVHTY